MANSFEVVRRWSRGKVCGVLASLLVVACVGCSHGTSKHGSGLPGMNLRPIEMVLKEHTPEWMSIPGVVGCGIGEKKGKPCILILVVKRTKELNTRLPKQVEGYSVVVKESGVIRALRDLSAKGTRCRSGAPLKNARGPQREKVES